MLFFEIFSLSRCCAVCVRCIILPVESWEPPIKSQPGEKRRERNHQSGAATLLVQRCSINHVRARQEGGNCRKDLQSHKQREATFFFVSRLTTSKSSLYRRVVVKAATRERNTLMCLKWMSLQHIKM